MHIGFFACYLSSAVVSGKSPFQARVVLNPLVSLMGRREPCSARIAADRETDGHTETHRPSTVTLAAHARRGLMKSANRQCITHARAMNIVVSTLVESLTRASYSSRFHACVNTVEPLLTTTSDKRPLRHLPWSRLHRSI